MAEKMTAESKISNYFQNRQSTGDITHLWAIFIHVHQYINKHYYLLRLAMTGSRNSIRWSSKPEVPIFQLVEELATRFQIIIRGFQGRAIRSATPNIATPQRKSEFKMAVV